MSYKVEEKIHLKNIFYLFQVKKLNEKENDSPRRGNLCSRDIPPDSQPPHVGVGLAHFVLRPSYQSQCGPFISLDLEVPVN